MKSESLKVEGMSCSHCVHAIEGALKEIEVSGKVDLENKSVQVEFDEEKVGLETIKKAIEDQGYEVG
jgi:copper chaperone